MNKKSSSGSGVFMMEMIMAVFFFILCASLCILVFVRADHMSRLAKDTNQGVIAAESMAEIWKAEGVDGLVTHMNGSAHGQTVEIYWDNQWTVIGDGLAASYEGTLSWKEGSGLEMGEIIIRRIKDGESLFVMEAAR